LTVAPTPEYMPERMFTAELANACPDPLRKAAW